MTTLSRWLTSTLPLHGVHAQGLHGENVLSVAVATQHIDPVRHRDSPTTVPGRLQRRAIPPLAQGRVEKLDGGKVRPEPAAPESEDQTTCRCGRAAITGLAEPRQREPFVGGRVVPLNQREHLAVESGAAEHVDEAVERTGRTLKAGGGQVVETLPAVPDRVESLGLAQHLPEAEAAEDVDKTAGGDCGSVRVVLRHGWQKLPRSCDGVEALGLAARRILRAIQQRGLEGPGFGQMPAPPALFSQCPRALWPGPERLQRRPTNDEKPAPRGCHGAGAACQPSGRQSLPLPCPRT
mmetsp:Transcript_163175/g.523326  ORF Transcript_163175/g.523326 Transcript_163175/m.523326 type:complete len:294 (-) Transcript_163175:1685-2566(-)